MATEKTGAGQTILIADDDAGIRMFLTSFLESLGYKAIAVADGEEAVKAVAEHRPSLLILDIDMPKGSGIVVTSQVRAHPDEHLRRVPIIMPTAKSDMRHEAYSSGAGATAFIAKPVAPNVLAEKIRELLPRAGRR